MRRLIIFLYKTLWLTFSVLIALVAGVGVAGGIMYINEKLNQYGTIWIGW